MADIQKAITFSPEQWEFFSKIKHKDIGVFASFSQEQLDVIGSAYKRQQEAQGYKSV